MASRGPSKLLYALGGWMLGNLAGLVLFAVAAPVLGTFLGPTIGLGVAYLAGMGCAIGGAVMGWKKAAREQHAAQGGVVHTTVSRSMEQGVSPELELSQEYAPSRFTDQVASRVARGGFAEAALADKAASAQAERGV